MWEDCLDDNLDIYANMEKYAKIVYKTDPIGEFGIILYLTTFDIEAFENNKNLEKIPTKEVGYQFRMADTQTWRDTQNPNMMLDWLEEKINRTIHDHYTQENNKLRDYIECMRKIEAKPRCMTYRTTKGNVTNCNHLSCDIIQGNLFNCDHVEVREVRGNMINCEVYKK